MEIAIVQLYVDFLLLLTQTSRDDIIWGGKYTGRCLASYTVLLICRFARGPQLTAGWIHDITPHWEYFIGV